MAKRVTKKRAQSKEMDGGSINARRPVGERGVFAFGSLSNGHKVGEAGEG